MASTKMREKSNEGKKQVGTLGNKDTTRARGKGHPQGEGAGQRPHEQFPKKKRKLTKHLNVLKVLRGDLYD